MLSLDFPIIRLEPPLFCKVAQPFDWEVGSSSAYTERKLINFIVILLELAVALSSTARPL